MTDDKIVERPPRGVGHDLLIRLGFGCPGFHGEGHSDQCNEITETLIAYGHWRERKAAQAETVQPFEPDTAEPETSISGPRPVPSRKPTRPDSPPISPPSPIPM